MKLFGMFLSSKRAQISAEMIIVMVALLAIAIVVVRKLTSTAETATEKLDEKTNALMDEIDNIDYNA